MTERLGPKKHSPGSSPTTGGPWPSLLPVGGWETTIGAASGTIEVLNQRGETVVDEIRGVRIAIEVDDVDASYRAAKQKGLTITLKPTTESWGAHRCWIEGPSGIRVALFTRTS